MNTDGRPITDINLDDEGFLWVGTFGNGIYKYDGLNYELFNNSFNDSSKLNDNFVRCSLIDRDKNLWVGTNKGISIYSKENNHFKSISVDDQRDVVTFEMIETKDQSLLLCTNSKGLYQKTLDNNIIYYPIETALEEYFKINSIATKNYSDYYLATNQGLFVFNDQNKTYKRLNLKEVEANVSIQKVHITPSGHLWIGTVEKGVYMVDLKNNTTRKYPITNARVMDFSESKWGIFAATENDGVFIFKEDGTYKHLEADAKKENALASNSVWSIHTVDQTIVLMGYYEFGLGLFDPNFYKFNQLTHDPYNKNSLGTSSVNSIVIGKNNVLWIGQDGGGITKYEKDNEKYTVINTLHHNLVKGLKSDAVQALFRDSKGQAWIATWGNGIYHLSKGNDHFTNLTKANSGLSSDRIIYFDEDTKGRIWIATFDRGVCYYDQSDNMVHYPNDGDFVSTSLSTKDVRKVLVDDKDNVWVASTEGLFFINTASVPFKVKRVLQGQLGGDNILSIYISNDNQLWIGTDGGGLYSYDLGSKKLTAFNGSDKINRRVICGIVEDNSGNIWVTSKNGIGVIQKWNNSIRYFSQKDGLVSENFNYNAVTFDSTSNTIYAGSIKGLNFINTSIIRPQECEAKIFLNSINIHQTNFQDDHHKVRKKISTGDKIILSQEENIFSIDFTGIDFPYSDKINFAYYLEGPEKTWNYVGANRSVTYTSLPKGDYVFHLKGMDNNGVWSEEKTLEIEVLPYWYQSNLAIGVYILLFLLGLYILNSLMKARVRILEEAKGERERRLHEEELTKAKLRFFTNISHEFRTPLTLILNPITDMLSGQYSTQQLKEKNISIYRNALRLKHLIDELMDFRKLNSKKISLKAQLVDPIEIIEESILFFEEEAESREINISIIKEYKKELKVYLDESMIEKIIFNLFSNAFKLMENEGEITIYLSIIGNYFRLSVEDTGPGISEENLDKVFDRFYQVDSVQDAYYGGTGVGLEVVKQFVDLHKGKISVESTLNVGTTFHLDFPIGEEHLSEDQKYQTESIVRKKYTLPVNDLKSKSQNETSSSSKKQSILLVEDNYELRSYLKEVLYLNYNIYEVNDGMAALDLLENKPIDIIISDVMMPKMNGFELCKNVKSNLKISHIPLILLTAKNDQEDKIKGIDLGADAYIQKPFDLELLQVTIKQLLKSRQILFDKFIGKFQENDFETENTTNVDKEFLKTITDYIYENISDSNLNVEQLSEVLHLSRSQLYRKIKALTGLTATVFIKRIRLEKAKQMILSGNSNISEVGYQTGFSSPSYFSKCYKEYFNILPTQEVKNIEV
ncbi:hybrid sensor histidine kinase/response regulator transcription factor [Flammeovirga agarivorans]|uniref:histidine kinase n=1 Tax=Flammeovirga agarivorans TaxID=2726742 RepID=A0A7X8SN94_9BACT|nr:hybrid sensor histidine kinase/response regulator transcription factor [Flammeovirga agarivorans]NLR93351.1 response regulator [Flammeovirga agarivorans]